MRIIWIALLVLFALVNIYAFVSGGFLPGFWHFLNNLGPWEVLLSVDLLIALAVALVFIARDAHQKGIRYAPYIVLTLFTGSIGILVYLVRYWGEKRTINAQRSRTKSSSAERASLT